MKNKLNQMSRDELLSYIQKWEKQRINYQSGSKNWRKCSIRINRAQYWLDGMNQ